MIGPASLGQLDLLLRKPFPIAVQRRAFLCRLLQLVLYLAGVWIRAAYGNEKLFFLLFVGYHLGDGDFLVHLVLLYGLCFC